MSKLRKLQAEIDGCLKRIYEGVGEWDALWDKLEETEDASQKDKIVQEMKKELKKLQRQREQVRAWAAGGEIKDAALGPRLLDARKEVEREMERFKQLEKELKIKQFSSEGLLRNSTDPLMVAKCRCADWLSDTVAQLETQVEQFEADIEAEASVQKGKTKSPRMLELEAFMARHQEHITRLEQCLRLLENDQVAPDEVEGALRDGLDYYLASSTEPDFMPDEHLYDALPLKDVDDSIGKIGAHAARPTGKLRPGEGGEGQAAESPTEGGSGGTSATAGKAKRSKSGKGGKGKGEAGKGEGGGAKKQFVAPPPGLPPPPASPQASGTPQAASRATSFKEVAAAGVEQGSSPSNRAPGSGGAPQTPGPSVQAGAATTPAGLQRKVSDNAAADASPQGFEPGATIKPSQPVMSSSPAAAIAGAASQPAPAAAPLAAPGTAAQLLAGSAPAQHAGPPLQERPLPPTSAARLAVFSEQMLLAVTAQRAQGEAVPGPEPAPEPLPAAAPPAPLPVLGVPPGLPPVALSLVPSLTGHSPFAALASGISAAAGGSPFALAAAREAGIEAQAAGSSSTPPVPAVSPLAAHRDPQTVTSLSSLRGSLGAADAEGQALAGESSAAASSVSSPQRGGRIPTVLSFNHLQTQAEAVLALPDSARPHSAAEGQGLEGAAAQDGVEGMDGAEALSHHQCFQRPWIPTLVDLHCLEASLAGRPQPGDADWRLSDGMLSSAGGPPPAQHPVVVPPSFPNTVHPSLRREETWKKLSAETCLLNFYFQQGSRQQLWGANALKAQGWRFHTQFNAWFARQSTPRTVTETHETGPLIFFDFNLHNVSQGSGLLPSAPQYSGWCPRVSRPDFMFEYKYMEQEDTSAPSDP